VGKVGKRERTIPRPDGHGEEKKVFEKGDGRESLDGEPEESSPL